MTVDLHYQWFWSLYQSSFIETSCFNHNYSSFFSSTYIILINIMMSNISMASEDSDVFHVEQSSTEPSIERQNTSDIFNSTELSEHHVARIPSVSSIASPQPHIITINDDSNEPTMPYGFGRQIPIVPQAWTIWTCRPILLISWRRWP